MVISSRCGGCEPAIVMEAFRCFPDSLTAVTYRAQLQATHETFGIDFRSIIEDFVTQGNTITVQSLVLRITPSCPVFVTGVNDEECNFMQPTLNSNFNTVVIVGGTIGGVVLLVNLIIIVGVVVIVVAIAKHRIAHAKTQTKVR